MKPVDIDDLIAERVLHLDGSPSVIVRIERPEPCDGGEGWYCPFTIAGLGDSKVCYAGGADPVQALQLVHGVIGTILCTSKSYRRGALRWDAGSDGNLGFSQP